VGNGLQYIMILGKLKGPEKCCICGENVNYRTIKAGFYYSYSLHNKPFLDTYFYTVTCHSCGVLSQSRCTLLHVKDKYKLRNFKLRKHIRKLLRGM
jgi:hypothetical protein